MFSRGGVTSVTPFPFHELIQGDKAQPVVPDMDVLHPFAAGLVRCVHIDGGYQLTQCIAVQFFNTDILVRFLNELFNVFVLSFLYFDLLLQGDRFRFQLLLLHFISLAQHIIAFIC